MQHQYVVLLPASEWHVQKGSSIDQIPEAEETLVAAGPEDVLRLRIWRDYRIFRYTY